MFTTLLIAMDIKDVQSPEERLFQFNKNLALAEKGDANAQFSVAIDFGKGEIIEKDFYKMMYWLKVSSQNGNPMALEVIQKIGTLINRKTTKVAHFEKQLSAATNGDAKAQLFVAIRYGKGEIVGRDLERMTFWLTQSSRRGNADARELLHKISSLVNTGDRDN